MPRHSVPPPPVAQAKRGPIAPPPLRFPHQVAIQAKRAAVPPPPLHVPRVEAAQAKRTATSTALVPPHPRAILPGTIQLASEAELADWLKTNADSAAWVDAAPESDFAVVRFTNQRMGGRPVDLELHVHLKGGRVDSAYAGSLFEAGKRAEGDAQAQNFPALNKIVDRWKRAQRSLTIDTPEAVRERATARRESEAQADLRRANQDLKALTEVRVEIKPPPAAAAADDPAAARRELVTRLVTDLATRLTALGMPHMIGRESDLVKAADDPQAKYDSILASYRGRSEHQAASAAAGTGDWRNQPRGDRGGGGGSRSFGSQWNRRR